MVERRALLQSSGVLLPCPDVVPLLVVDGEAYSSLQDISMGEKVSRRFSTTLRLDLDKYLHNVQLFMRAQSPSSNYSTFKK